jgi:hypothetical protein
MKSPITTILGVIFILVALTIETTPFFLDLFLIYKGTKVAIDLKINHYVPGVLGTLGLLLILAPDDIVKIIKGWLRKKEYIDEKDINNTPGY